MRLARWLLPYDFYERHYVVAKLIAAYLRCGTVLDVGGRIGALAQFTPCRVFSVNIDGSGDVQYAGGTLPFADQACDIVTAIDTLEHLPREQRISFVCECLRVSRGAVILAAPFGSAGHAETEARLSALFKRVTGHPHRYLDEHVRYGLPGLEEIESWIAQSGIKRYRMLFAGDYRREARFFTAALQYRQAKRLMGRLQAFAWHVCSRALFNRLHLSDYPLPYTNRFYLALLNNTSERG